MLKYLLTERFKTVTCTTSAMTLLLIAVVFAVLVAATALLFLVWKVGIGGTGMDQPVQCSS